MIIVTGASSGIGRNICERLIASRVDVLGIAREVSSLSFPAIACDVSSNDDVKNVVREIKKKNLSVDGLVNAAGVASMNLAVSTPFETAKKIIEVNLLGTINCCQQFAPLMMRKKNGVIINFSTIAVSLGLKGESVYAASKSGVESFTRVFAREIADFGLTANCIAPGPIDTNLLRGISKSQISKIVSQQVIPKQFSIEAVSDLVEILLDYKSRSLSGQVLHVGGA